MSTNSSDSSASWKLTSRQRSIIEIIAKMSGKPVPIGAISEKLGISSRTVLRELPSIEQWMDENDFTFIRKPGVGLVIEEDPETIKLLEELLDMERVHTTYTQRERRRLILGELLFLREPVKSFVFLSRFHISERTLTKDLDALDKWLSTYQIQILRRPGIGIMLEGSESAYRQAIANAALEFMSEGEILKLLRRSEDEQPIHDSGILENRLFSFIDPQILVFVEQILTDTENKLKIKYTDSGYMALIVHLSLAIRRLRSGEKIEMDPAELKNLQELPEYPVAEQIAEQIGSQLNLIIPPEEVGFITMHLSSARIWPQTRRNRSQLQSINARQVVMTLVDNVEQEVSLPFHTCTRMIEELTSHMDSMLNRLSMNIHLDNAQGDSIRQNYPDIYQAVENACGLLKEFPYIIEDISSSEIAFITMHFAAAAETLRVEQKKVTVAVVCPSGMGASRMLAANLMRSLRNIEIRQIMSAFNLEPKLLRENGIDLVISTVPLTVDFPSICVSPIPQAQDMLIITNMVEAISSKREEKVQPEQRAVQPDPEFTWKDIRSLTRTGEEISQLLDHFLIRELTGIHEIGQLLGQAAALFADSILNRQLISQDLARREAVKNTFIPEMDLYLLHCRTAAVSHCRFGYLKLKQPLFIPEGTVAGAVLMLAPQADSEECVEVISRISMLLVEDKRFLQALQCKDTVGGRSLAEQALVKYYQTLINKRKGDGKL